MEEQEPHFRTDLPILPIELAQLPRDPWPDIHVWLPLCRYPEEWERKIQGWLRHPEQP